MDYCYISSSDMSENGGMSPGSDQHFPTFEERTRTSMQRMYRRTASPTHSAHSALIRTSLFSNVKKAKKVQFYRNGDMYFRGMLYAVSHERFRTFESLLVELTDSPIGDKNVMPNGVRHIFSMDGSRKITSIDELEEGEGYVCASTHFFKKMNYPRSSTPCWSYNSKGQDENGQTSPHPGLSPMEDNRDFIRPKLITVIRNGSRPRKAVRILLNKKTAHSMDQVLNDINDAIKLTTGSVKKIFTMDGKQILSLADFFGEETTFLAYGPEKYSLDDFDLDGNEIRYVNAYGSVRQNERITMKSPKAPRRLLHSPKKSPRSTESFDFPRRRSPQPRSSSPLSQTRVPATSPKPGRRSNNIRSRSPGSNHMNGHSNTDSAMVHREAPPSDLTENYKIGQTIGEGNFAVVKECLHRESKEPFALKIISKARCKGKEQMIDNEVSILRLVKHPNVIELVEEYDTPHELYLVMELVKGGDLFEAITSATKYTERDASSMVRNLVSAIKYLHALRIVHRDIKPENLLVCTHPDGSTSLKLGDFGLATEVIRGEKLLVVCGTPTYVAPEVLSETGYGVKVDVWAVGIITYILLCGFPPFVSVGNNQEELFDKILEGKFNFKSPYWDDISESAKELITMMLQVDPDLRISASEAQQHPWLSADAARDKDMHSVVASKLGENFSRKWHYHEKEPGVALIAATALDKASRYFQGRKQLQLQEFNGAHNGDEVF